MSALRKSLASLLEEQTRAVCRTLSPYAGTGGKSPWQQNSLLSPELKQQARQGLWVLCGGGQRLVRGWSNPRKNDPSPTNSHSREQAQPSPRSQQEQSLASTEF